MKMALRSWQIECIDAAMHHYHKHRHFFCQATPAAGKTRLAAELAKELLEQRLIDVVVCFAPSCEVVDGIRRTFEKVLSRPFHGQLGAVGVALTYQAIEHKDCEFWRLFNEQRVFAVFDEIHHCSAGSPLQAANSWGEAVLQKLQDSAAYTLALSGTPWRSDEQAIALARYSDPEGQLIVDFQYSLRRAVTERVCRIPRIRLVDNSLLRLSRSGDVERSFDGFSNLLRQSCITYEELVANDEINRYMIQLAVQQLNLVRQKICDAAGLLVASNIEHAYRIAACLHDLGESAVVVTTHSTDAQSMIHEFRHGQQRWIVAVGMISEGTDIPRLQLCCYLSRIRTEMYFRQVLGRVLRHRGVQDDHAWLLMLAEPTLVTFANRIADDLPEDASVVTHLSKHDIDNVAPVLAVSEIAHCNGLSEMGLSDSQQAAAKISHSIHMDRMHSFKLSVAGVFREQLLMLF